MYQNEAVEHPDVLYIDIWSTFTTRSGKYAAYLPDASTGDCRGYVALSSARSSAGSVVGAWQT